MDICGSLVDRGYRGGRLVDWGIVGWSVADVVIWVAR